MRFCFSSQGQLLQTSLYAIGTYTVFHSACYKRFVTYTCVVTVKALVKLSGFFGKLIVIAFDLINL